MTRMTNLLRSASYQLEGTLDSCVCRIECCGVSLPRISSCEPTRWRYGVMKHRSIQFGTRRNPESPRVDTLHFAADSSSASFRGEEDPCERGEPYCSQPTVSSCERNRGQVESDAGFEPLLDVVEAARLLRIHPKTLQKL